MKLKKITTDDLHFLGLGDGNSPNARTQTGAKSMCQVLHIVNSMKPTHSACLLTVPDLPLDSSARGLDDEETKLRELLWDNNQHCDTRWIATFDPDPRSEACKITSCCIAQNSWFLEELYL